MSTYKFYVCMCVSKITIILNDCRRLLAHCVFPVMVMTGHSTCLLLYCEVSTVPAHPHGLALPCPGPRSPFQPLRAIRPCPAWQGALLSWAYLQAHSPGRASAARPSPAVPMPQPRGAASPCCTTTRTMKNDLSKKKKKVKERNATNTAGNLSHF